MPPRWFRRIVLAPVALVLISAVLVTMPLWLLLAGVLGPLGSGRLRFLRVSWMVAVYIGLHAMAERAERMRHVLAPRPGGTLAALDAAPEAGVIWVAHTGLDKLLTVADVWRHLPLDLTITMRWWSVEPSDVPAGHEERVEWLYEWWARIDGWIDRHNPHGPAS